MTGKEAGKRDNGFKTVGEIDAAVRDTNAKKVCHRTAAINIYRGA
jgi:hypothetical protein